MPATVSRSGTTTPIFLVLDGHQVHKAKLIKEFVQAQQGRLKLFYLPPYSPHLNPDEQASSDKTQSTKTPDDFSPGVLLYWWRWRESNPRPKALDARYYMLSSLLDLVPRQHSVRGASKDQPA
jgi:transposase